MYWYVLETIGVQYTPVQGFKCVGTLRQVGGHNLMPRMLGDRHLPEAVQDRRRKLRMKVRDLRAPIRSKRSELVPGPDIVGKVEQKVGGLRDSFVSRDSVLSRIKERRADGSSGSGSSSSSGSSGSSSSSGGSDGGTTKLT